MKKLDDWLQDPETRKKPTPCALASKLHFKLMQIFPFSKHTGKLARLGMNLVLLRAGYPPAIIHSTERQRYYESLKGPSLTLHNLMVDSLENSIESAIKLFAEQRTGRRAMA
jgi:Fic family protein